MLDLSIPRTQPFQLIRWVIDSRYFISYNATSTKKVYHSYKPLTGSSCALNFDFEVFQNCVVFTSGLNFTMIGRRYM